MTDERVKAICQKILAVRNTEASRNLVMDVWMIREEKGTDEAVTWGRMILEGVKRYQEHDDYIHRNLFAKPEA